MPQATSDNEDLFKRIADDIHRQNLALISRVLHEPDFNPGPELDNTRNGAAYKIVDFFDACKLFPYGEVPARLADPMLESSDRLLEAIRQRYGSCGNVVRLVIEVGHRFRGTKRIWRICRGTQSAMSDEEYCQALDACKNDVLDALDDLNAELDACADRPSAAKPKAASRKQGLRGRKTPFMERQLRAFASFVVTHPITPSCKPASRARQCWLEHLAEWDAAAGNGTGYSSYKALSRAYLAQ